MAFTNDTHQNTHSLEQFVQQFQKLNADDQLAVLGMIYNDMKASITPKGGPDTSGFEIAQGLVNQMKQRSQMEQLQIQRDAIQGATSNEIAAAYRNFNSSNRLAFWYLLGQGMEEGSIVPIPPDYHPTDAVQALCRSLQALEFNDQITFMRNVVALTGERNKPGAAV